VIVPPAICHGPGCLVPFSTEAGSSWRSVWTAWKSPAGLRAVRVTEPREDSSR
jgi:hypothetical protein